MADYEARVFLIGGWRNFEHLEECLSLPEIKIILETHQQLKRQDQEFMAALQGVDLNKNAYKEKMKEIQERARAKIHGGEIEWEKASLSDLGMFVEESEDEGTVLA